MRVRRLGPRLVLALAALTMGAAACTAGEASTRSLLDQEKLVIGTNFDQPGIGTKTDSGELEGLDIDVARYIAEHLGFDRSDVEFVEATSDNREELLTEGKADLVIAFWAIRADTKVTVDFAGPYFIARQDILVREDNNQIQGVRDLQGRQMCDAEGSGSWGRITQERKVQPVHVTRPGWGACIAMLKVGEVVAVSTEDAILAGYVRGRDSGLKFVNAPFTEERIGIGVPKDDPDACEAINRGISKMYQDGTAERLLDKWFGDTGLNYTTEVPQFEGCE